MEQANRQPDMLDLLTQPAFYAQNGRIVQVNQAAAQLGLEPGTDVTKLLSTGADEYRTFQSGELSLSISVENAPRGATVARLREKDVFILEQPDTLGEFRALSLAAQELRDPLSTIMTLSDRLFSALPENPENTVADSLAQFNQGLYKMLRLIGNMSYAEKFSKETAVYTETCNIRTFFEELCATSEKTVSSGGRTLQYRGLEKDLFCLINQELLERAFYNLLSNAIKFSPQGATINVSLIRNQDKLYLTFENPFDGISERNFFTAFRKEPGIFDGRCGMGLGMVLIRSAACAHGGTVLAEQTDSQARVTFSLQINQNPSNSVRSPILRVDYAGERDHRLIELADALPSEAYKDL